MTDSNEKLTGEERVQTSPDIEAIRILAAKYGLHIVTDADQCVLDAMAAARVGSDSVGGFFLSNTSPICLAELARREAKRG